jgi:hypothetical protein
MSIYAVNCNSPGAKTSETRAEQIRYVICQFGRPRDKRCLSEVDCNEGDIAARGSL